MSGWFRESGILTPLGATDAEDRIYCYLITTVSATDEEISAAIGLPSGQVAVALRGLEERHLVSRTADRTHLAVTAPTTVEAMIAGHLRGLRSAQETLDRAMARYRAQLLPLHGPGVFEVVRGADALRETALRILHSARDEVVNMVKPPIVAIQLDEQALPGDGVRGRTIYDTEAIGVAGSLDAIRSEIRPLDEVRVHTKLPVKMLAADRSLALLPLGPQHDSTPIGVVIYGGAFLDAFLALFDYVWSAAVPLRVIDNGAPGAREPGGLSAEDRRLLSLLLSGLTDEAIAAHFRVSVRTVERKVQAMMRAANVRSRIQLAWEAARHGWA
jgi:DNA-binding CsgD family transcriptional regulator